MLSLVKLSIRFRPWTYTPDSRLPGAESSSPINGSPIVAHSASVDSTNAPGAEARRPEKSADLTAHNVAAPVTIPPEFAVKLCNSYFRISRNAAQMEREGVESKELRGIRGALARMDEAFQEHGIDCRDLTGEVYDEGREDFEPLLHAQAEAGLDTARIAQCERPCVHVQGQLVQKARGLVRRPLES